MPNLIAVDDALGRLLAGAQALSDIEAVPTLSASGRVLAAAQKSGMDVPPMDNSAMDGYAVRIADVAAPGAKLRIAQRIAAGSVGDILAPGTAARIFTGAPIPPGADAVVMQEHTEVLNETAGDSVVVKTQPRPSEWIRRTGSDIRKGEVILPAGRKLQPQDCGLAASVGIASLPVVRRVRLGLFFTGDELVMPGDALAPGRIYNSNRFTLNGLAQAFDCEVRDYGIVPDSLEATRAALRRAASECDLIVTSGGVSVGEADFVKPAVEAEGELLLWRIAMKPGRPLAFGRVRPGSGGGAGASFIGLPGNPVASFVTFLWFVRPFLMRLSGVTEVAPRVTAARADFDWTEPDARREFLRAKWNGEGGLDLYPTQDSAVMSSTVWADGLVDNPPGTAIRRGDSVRFVEFKDLLA
jgi:molybdopterin molybdotransferase